MEIRLLNVAQQEMDESFEFYEEQMAGLGHDFLAEILATLKRIKQDTDAWTPFSNRTRRCLVNRFPFGVVYQVQVDAILVVAIAHLHRKPGYWENRIEK
ncbi:type II toxin-antitoxin system RelE/ParE family toxin [Gracilimonas sp. Q87]|uniref:type II toxin-antitoxin system RelE/ParE family toxin n=1 Tax=Gracilimonas sp. Q87 TaxID=3384766 RepID=UPI00398456BB